MLRQPWSKALAVISLSCALGLGACADVPTDDTPAGALRLFLAAMERSRSEPSARERVYGLLSESSREELRRRARLATALAGARTLSPWELLVPGRFALRVAPRPNDAFEAHVDGDRATVTVHGRRGTSDAEVPMVREAGHWRVVLELPAATSDGAGGGGLARPPKNST